MEKHREYGPFSTDMNIKYICPFGCKGIFVLARPKWISCKDWTAYLARSQKMCSLCKSAKNLSILCSGMDETTGTASVQTLTGNPIDETIKTCQTPCSIGNVVVVNGFHPVLPSLRS